MAEPLPETTLTWLRHTAKFYGATTAKVLLHLLERVEALEQRSTCAESAQVPPTPGPNDEAWRDFIEQIQHAQHVAIREGEVPRFDLVEMAQALWREALEQQVPPTPEAAPVATDEELLVLYNLPGSFADSRRAAYNLGRQHGAAQPPAAQPTPPSAPAGGLVERVAELRQKFEQLIKRSRAYDGYSTMTPVELADRLVDAVLVLEANR
jgi:hypothetical protein